VQQIAKSVSERHAPQALQARRRALSQAAFARSRLALAARNILAADSHEEAFARPIRQYVVALRALDYSPSQMLVLVNRLFATVIAAESAQSRAFMRMVARYAVEAYYAGAAG
jgi:hypothetical protein